jgi:hypothetical protein
LSAFSNDGSLDECSHEELFAIDLAEKLMPLFRDAWTDAICTGWQLFCFLLRSSHEEWNRATQAASGQDCDGQEMDIDSDSEDDDSEDNDSGDNDSGDDDDDVNSNCADHDEKCLVRDNQNFFGKNKDLGTFHAAIQTELLTYRRLADGDAWTSNNFNMQEILWSLTTEEEPSIGLAQKGLMKPHCRCGIFIGDWDLCMRAEQACSSYFMNLEDWSRTEFIIMPGRDPDGVLDDFEDDQ